MAEPDLIAQLRHDPDPLGRIVAAQALGKKGTRPAVQALAAALIEDPFWGVRVEVAGVLGGLRRAEVVPLLAQGLIDPEMRVRKASVQALGQCPYRESFAVLHAALQQPDLPYSLEATLATALGKVAAAPLVNGGDAALEILQAILNRGPSWNEVVRGGAITGIADLKTPAGRAVVLDYTQAAIPQALRLAAIRALGTGAAAADPPVQAQVLARLEQLASEPFFLTQVAVVTALERTETPQAIPLLRRLHSQSSDGRVRRMAEEAMGRLQDQGPAGATLQLMRADLEKLQRENQDLRQRLEKLEARLTSPSEIL